MIKRPLCLIFLCFAAGIWLFDLTGGTAWWRAPEDQILSNHLEQESRCVIAGKVLRKEDKANSAYIYLKNANLNVQSEQFFSKKVIIRIKEAPDLGAGNIIVAEGSLECIQEATNPGQFDTRGYYHTMDVDFFVAADSISISDSREEFIPSALNRIRIQFGRKLDQLVPDHSGTLSAMLLGDRSMLGEIQKDRFQMSGITHILAISGLHLSLLGMGLYRLMIRLGIPSKAAGAVSVVLLASYTVLTGASVSAQRALLMFGLLMGSRIVGRTYDMLSALSLAGVLILLQNPSYLYYSGFLLSFGAAAALGGVLPVFKKDHQKEKQKSSLWLRLKKGIGTGLLSGSVIWFATLPIVLYFFYEVSVYGLIINLVVIPTVGIILLSGILGGIAGFISMAAGKAILLPAVVLLDIYDQMGRIVQRLPFPTLILGRPDAWQIILYYAAGIVILIVWKRRKKERLFQRIILCIVISGMTAVLSIRMHSGLSVTALDVGQGDALVVQTDSGNTYLIDGGSSSVNQVGRYRIMPYLKSQGIRHLEGVVITHPDSDHFSGILELLEAVAEHTTSLSVKQCLLPAWMEKIEDESGIIAAANRAGVKIQYLKKGDRIHEGKTKLQVLHPDDKIYSEDFNAGSLTFILEYGAFSGLFTGDLCGEGEAAVQQLAEPCDFLKVAHHGSKYSTDELFLQQVQPKISIISCSAKNLYGHPHPDLMERIAKTESETYLTMQGGAITLQTDGESGVWVKQFCGE